MRNVTLRVGDITTARADAIINAANSAMLGGGGVDGAIHRAAGPGLLEACRQVAPRDGVRCPTGEARITAAGRLAASHVIHAVGPRYHIDPNPPTLLASAYRHSFQLALQHRCHRVAAPAISCGVYAYPLREAAQVALAVCAEEAFRDMEIVFYLFDREIHEIWSGVHSELSS
jgi:O-acetyl-ADP-ribose deacetylase (regulator of RNase III)